MTAGGGVSELNWNIINEEKFTVKGLEIEPVVVEVNFQ